MIAENLKILRCNHSSQGLSVWCIGIRVLRDFSSQSCLVEESDFWGFETRNRNRWILRTDTGIGIGTAQSPEPRLESELVLLDLKNRYWNRYRHRSISRTELGIRISIIQILGLATVWIFLIIFPDLQVKWLGLTLYFSQIRESFYFIIAACRYRITKIPAAIEIYFRLGQVKEANAHQVYSNVYS